MGFDTIQERRKLEREIEKEHKIIRRIKAHDEWLTQELFPKLYKRRSRKPINEKLVVFASSKSGTLPDSMKSLYVRLTEKGYQCEFFGRTPAFKTKHEEKKYYRKFFSYFAICRCLFIDDVFVPVYSIEVRPGQRVVQLWHTSALLRKTGYAVGKRGVVGETTDREVIHTNYTDIVASSPFVKDTLSSAFKSDVSKIHAWGCPRTDIYFDKKFVSEAREKIIKSIQNLPSRIGDRKIILYAPTYRGKNEQSAYALRTLDLLLLKRYLGDEYVFLIKMHPFVKKESYCTDEERDLISDFAFEVPSTVKTETALCAADVLVTDYSTLLFDYSLLCRPMIFYAFDFKRYTKSKPLFYNYERFVPGPIVYDSGELAEAIISETENFDEERMKCFKDRFMGGCDGNATERTIHYAVKRSS